jgi:prepilin-type N-terminal cleavage/methylation domain-containing protein
MSRNFQAGFSLVEVSVAVGVLALGLVAIVALMVPSVGRSADVSDAATAARLVEGINQELRRMGFVEVRDGVVGSDGSENKTIWLVATRDGSRIMRSGRTPGEPTPFDSDAERALDLDVLPGIAQRDRYFLVSLSRLTSTTSNPLYYTVAKGFLALKVRVFWPYLVPVDAGDDTATVWNNSSVAGVEADEDRRSSVFLTASVRR